MGMRKGLRQVTAFGVFHIPIFIYRPHDKQIIPYFPKPLSHFCLLIEYIEKNMEFTYYGRQCINAGATSSPGNRLRWDSSNVCRERITTRTSYHWAYGMSPKALIEQ